VIHRIKKFVCVLVTLLFVVLWVHSGLEANTDKTKYMVTSRDQDAGRSHTVKTKYMVTSRDQDAVRSHTVKIDYHSFERGEEFKYLGTTLTNQNFTQEEIKSRSKSGNVCYHSVQNFCLPVCYPKTTILPAVLYGCENWSH